MRNLERSEAYASFLLSQGMAAINRADNLSGEEAGSAYEEALEALKGLAEEYGATDSGELGVFFIGKCLSRLKRYGEAAEQYEEFLKLNVNQDEPLYRSLAIQSLGFVYQHEKEFEKALACFNELLQTEGSFLRGEALLGLAQIHEETGQHEKAVEAYREFLSSYPGSTEANRIQRRLALFEKRFQ
jgi:tetratricopeptide (TPR) repeat protein